MSAIYTDDGFVVQIPFRPRRLLHQEVLQLIAAGQGKTAYRRGDLFEKRRQLAEAWAAFCATPPATGGWCRFVARLRANDGGRGLHSGPGSSSVGQRGPQ